MDTKCYIENRVLIYIHKLDNGVKEEYYIPLQKVTPAQLAELRLIIDRGFVVKGIHSKDLFFGDISALPNVRLMLTQGEVISHICNSCSRQSALPDEQGGCAKCRNFAKEIEKFPWITSGYEFWGNTSDVFMVTTCDHYEHDNNLRFKSKALSTEKKVQLAQYLWEWVESYPDVRAEMRKAQ